LREEGAEKGTIKSSTAFMLLTCFNIQITFFKEGRRKVENLTDDQSTCTG